MSRPAAKTSSMPPSSKRPASPKAHPAAKARQRLPRAERQALVLDKAAAYFAEHGLNAQTRAIAHACGVSQRLLYSLFPNKASLIDAIYEREVAGTFKPRWFELLQDRTLALEARLVAFYTDYYETLLTRRWLRLFLYSSLGNLTMAPSYTNAVVTRSLEIIVAEAAHEAGRGVPESIDQAREIGWLLHGAISHLAIRRRIYANENTTPVSEVIGLSVRAFLASLPAVLPEPRSSNLRKSR